MIDTKYPKGGMCASCKKAQDDCSALPFNSMNPVRKNSDAVICTEYKRNKLESRLK